MTARRAPGASGREAFTDNEIRGREDGPRRQARAHRGIVRVLVVAMLAALAQVAGVAAPSFACACGAMEPPTEDDSFKVSDETALVKHDNGMEDIYMSFDVQGSSDRSALILPLPAKAQFDLGPKDLFPQLLEMSKPEIRVVTEERTITRGEGTGSGAAAEPGSSVRNLGTTDLGPMTVTQLASKDSGELAAYLKKHGFRTRDNVVKATQGYLDKGWVVAVAQLKSDAALNGALPPVHARFPSREMVYPMVLQGQAESSAGLRVYTLTPHKMEARLPGTSMETIYSGHVNANDQERFPSLQPLTEAPPASLAPTAGPGRSAAPGVTPVKTTGWVLTRFDGTVSPETVTDDMTFVRAADDSPYRKVITEHRVVYVNREPLGFVDDAIDAQPGTTWRAGLGVGGVALLLAAGAWAVRRRRDPSTR